MAVTTKNKKKDPQQPDSVDQKSEQQNLLHRIATIRKRQGVSLRSVARQMDVEVRRLRVQENETTDLPLSTLYAWQRVLDVPIGELLVEDNDPLSAPVLQRARMVKIMKTLAAILERDDPTSIQRLAQMLSDQLVEIMPELKDVGPWHSVGQRRTMDEYGKILERCISEESLFGRHDRH